MPIKTTKDVRIDKDVNEAVFRSKNIIIIESRRKRRRTRRKIDFKILSDLVE